MRVLSQGERSGLDDEVVDRGDGTGLRGGLLQLRRAARARRRLSASVWTWKCGIVDFASAIRRAITRCRRVSSSVCVPEAPFPPTAGRAPGAVGPPGQRPSSSGRRGARGPRRRIDGRGLATPAAPRTSAVMILPRGPVPASEPSETPWTAARRRASGSGGHRRRRRDDRWWRARCCSGRRARRELLGPWGVGSPAGGLRLLVGHRRGRGGASDALGVRRHPGADARDHLADRHGGPSATTTSRVPSAADW